MLPRARQMALARSNLIFTMRRRSLRTLVHQFGTQELTYLLVCSEEDEGRRALIHTPHTLTRAE